MIQKNDDGVSVIVCCYNSEDRLTETIKHLALQVVPDNINWEVIIVNNASTDYTVEKSLTESQKYIQLSEKFSIVNEPKPGLSFARETGVLNAAYSFIIFCDDDNWLDPNYVSLSYNIISKDKQIGAIGGQGFAVTSDGILPSWFRSVQSWYAIGEQNSCIKNSLITCNLWGAGLVTRKKLYLQLVSQQFPPVAIGRQGNKLSAGEDTEFCLRLILKGYKTCYINTLKYYHFIPKQRLQTIYRDKLKQGFEVAGSQMVKYFILIQMQNESIFSRLLFISKITLGYFSTFFGRKSWNAENVEVALFFGLNIDLGVDKITMNIYKFYKSEID